MKKTYQKVRDTIESCQNYGQYMSAIKFAGLFWKRFVNDLDTITFNDYVEKLEYSANTKLRELKEIL